MTNHASITVVSLALCLGGLGGARPGLALGAEKKVKAHKVPQTRDKYLTTQYKKQNRDQITKIATGKAAEAAAYYDAYLKAIPDDLESMFGMTAACAQTGHFDKAMFWMTKSVENGLPFERYLAGPRDLFEPLYRQHAFREYARTQNRQLLHGPVLGSVTDARARFWVRTKDEIPVTIRVTPSADQKAEAIIASSRTNKTDDYTAVVEVKGLKPNTRYTYEVLFNNEPAAPRKTASFRTFPRVSSQAQFTLAFGGGAGYTPWFEHMWNTMAEARPLAMIALGDNVYIDTPDVHQTQRYCYYRRQSRPEYRAFAAATPIFAVWDDHDFAGNDCCNGPTFEDPPWKKEVLKVFTENFVNPAYGGGDKTPGIWFDFKIGDVDFFMLDTRMYRDFRDTTPRSMLGPVQKQWLKERLKTSRATFKVIASSLPWAMGAKPGSKDPWSGFPDEREELFQFIEQNRINGVVLISADRHRSDAWKISRTEGYDLYEFMSSKMTNVVKHGLMKGALFGYNEKCSYGRLTFDTKAADPTVTYTIVNIDGEDIHSLTVKKSQLMHQE